MMKTPQIMGILNITPDSFSDGGRYNTVEQAVSHAQTLTRNGAHILDIGAESTRPGATPLTHEQEWERLEPVLPPLRDAVNLPLSIDTRHPETAMKALDLGADIINDVSGFTHKAMIEAVKNQTCPIVVMHNLGVPADKNIVLESNDPVDALYRWTEDQIAHLQENAIDRSRIIFDPGIGFGKNAQQSMELLANIHLFTSLGVKILVGHSRKSFLSEYSTQHIDKEEKIRDIETYAASLHLAEQGVDIVRVHDVAEHQRLFTLYRHLNMHKKLEV